MKIPILGQGVVSSGNNVVQLTPDEIIIFKAFHVLAQRHGLGVYHPACMSSLAGKNSEHDRILSVECACTEFRGENRDRRIVGPSGHAPRPS